MPPAHQAFLLHTNGGELEFLSVKLFGIDRDDALDFAEQVAFLSRFIEGVSEKTRLPFAVDAGGSVFCYDLTRPTESGDYPVLYWNIEYSEEPDDAPKLWSEYAPGFTAFLLRLRTTEAEMALTEALHERDWVIQHRPDAVLPEAIVSRYPNLPGEVTRFLSSLAICHNPSQSVWFLMPDDYARTPSNQVFDWNELERMGGASCFWDQHFPFLYAVHSNYDYLAVRLTDEGFGAIVHGFAPEWEEPNVIAPDLTAFLEAFTTAAQSDVPAWPYSVFLRR
nr:SMI1/KNR4 family protein [Armatimonas rosea]